MWRGQDSWYNPDFLVRESDGVTWIIEVKSDRDLESADVQEKKKAAERWARRVNASGQARPGQARPGSGATFSSARRSCVALPAIGDAWRRCTPARSQLGYPLRIGLVERRTAVSRPRALVATSTGWSDDNEQQVEAVRPCDGMEQRR